MLFLSAGKGQGCEIIFLDQWTQPGQNLESDGRICWKVSASFDQAHHWFGSGGWIWFFYFYFCNWGKVQPLNSSFSLTLKQDQKSLLWPQSFSWFLFFIFLPREGKTPHSDCLRSILSGSSPGFQGSRPCSAPSIYFSTAARRVSEAESQAVVAGSVDPCTINWYACTRLGISGKISVPNYFCNPHLAPLQKSVPALLSLHLQLQWPCMQSGTIFFACLLS